MNSFTFGNYNSANLHLYIEKRPSPVIPERRKTVYRVAGRDDDLVEDEGCFNNIPLSYQVGCANIDNNLPNIKAMLAQTGYQTLRDTYRTNGYRRAYLNNAVAFSEDLLNFGHANIEFSADPYFYLDSGSVTSDYISQGQNFSNPTQYVAKPYISVEMVAPKSTDTVVNLSIGSNTYHFTIEKNTAGVMIDSMSEVMLRGNTNVLKYYESDTFPVFEPSTNYVSWTATNPIKIRIKPRWREI